MASDQQQLEERSTDDYGLEPNTSPADELAAVSALARGAGELMIIQTLHRFIGPVLVPVLTPLIRQIVEERIELAKQDILASIKKNPANEATTSVPKRLKLQFRNKISVPVYTGKRLLGENETTIEVALVDAFTEQIITTGNESTAKIEIVGFLVDGTNDRWTSEEFQEKVMSEKKRKRVLQGETSLQLENGVCFVSKISFTHNSENTKNGWYRLGAGVVDGALINRVDVARTEAFLMKDGRTTYYEKHAHPLLSDRVCHLQQISYKGSRHRRLKDEGIITVKDLLILLYTNPQRLQDILKVGPSSNIWGDIVKNAEASSGVFLWIDPGNEGEIGVVLNAKRQLHGLIVENHKCVHVGQLSAKQKEDSDVLVKFAFEHFEMLRSFEDEISLEEYLNSLPSTNQRLGTSNIIVEPATPSSLTSTGTPNNSNLHKTQTPVLTSQYERGKAVVPFDNDLSYPMTYHHENMPPHPFNFETRNGYYPTEPGTSSQAVDSPIVNTCGHMNNCNVFGQCMMDSFLNNHYFSEEFSQLLGHDYFYDFDCPIYEGLSEPVNSVSVCTIGRARTRWTKVSKLLMNMILFKDGIRALKRQRCC